MAAGDEKPLDLELSRLHDEAVARDQDLYLDPKTGFAVFTARYLSDRGECCHNCCRHCPW